MKYDLEKCNNLNFRLNDGTTGFIKVSPAKDAYLYASEKCRWDIIGVRPRFNLRVSLSNGGSLAKSIMEQRSLEIIPRDPETYQDWKVGDRFLKGGRVFEIRVEDNGFFFAITDDGFSTGRTDRLFSDDGARLVLTDYEKELIHAQEKEKCPFKKGDRVLVRDRDDDRWLARIFDCYHKELKYKYECKDDKGNTDDDMYIQCLPFNEHTWQLLGTTDEYKAIDNNESH